MLIDQIDVTFEGGKGGNGIVSFGKMAHSGPDGGNGGKGGDIYVVAESDITLLSQFSRLKVITGNPGENGGKNKRTGKGGDDITVKLPFGTSLIDKTTGKVLFELKQVGEKVLLCSGGDGGWGNYEFRSPIRTTPKFAKPGKAGEVKDLTLNLKLIANFGLIGLPNAGKSSLLNEITKAKAKIGAYPFTTLTPNLGVVNGKIIADIPGLIEGASGGRGLGVSFLKHIEKVSVILHCISADSLDITKDYRTVREELGKYNKKLLTKREIILITKSDLVTEKILETVSNKLSKVAKEIYRVSIHDWESIDKLKNLITL